MIFSPFYQIILLQSSNVFLKNGISGIPEEWKKKTLSYEEVFELAKKMVGICAK